MHPFDKFTNEGEAYEMNFGTEIVLPSGRKFFTFSFDSVTIIDSPKEIESLPVTVRINNNKMTHVSRYRNMEEAELGILAIAYFCDSTQYFEDVRREVEGEDADVALD